MSGCRRYHLRLNTPVQDVEENLRVHQKPCGALFLRSTCPYSPAVCLWRSQQQRRVGFNLSHSKPRCQGQEQSAVWYVACGTPFF